MCYIVLFNLVGIDQHMALLAEGGCCGHLSL